MNHFTKSVLGVTRSWHRGIAYPAGLAVSLCTMTSLAQTAPPEREPGADTMAPTPEPAAPVEAESPSAAAAPRATETSATGEAPRAIPPTEAPLPAASAASVQGLDSLDDAAINAQAEQAASEIATSAESSGSKLNIYGFSDFTFAKRLSKNSSDIITPRASTFYVGNLNLYLNAERGRWRSLSEVRFTYLPDGADTYDAATGEAGRISSSYADYADFGRQKKVGGVIIERVWLEYSAHQLLTIRAGQFLTPYGIWNVDHGSPVVINVVRPHIIGNELFPAHQTGFELYGSYGINATQLGYHVTLSNGRGPVDSYQDLDSNKAVGWRAWVKHDSSLGTMTLGTSGYRGRYTDSSSVYGLVNGGLNISYPIQTRYDELSLAADLKWNWGGLLLQGEAILHDIRYDNRHRAAAAFAPAGTAWETNQRVWGYYTIAGYRFDWLGVMPFFGTQYQDWGKGNAFSVWAFSGGLNVRPNDMVVFKLAGIMLNRPHPGVYSKSESQISTQVAWSF
jgi:hypothetical protein